MAPKEYVKLSKATAEFQVVVFVENSKMGKRAESTGL